MDKPAEEQIGKAGQFVAYCARCRHTQPFVTRTVDHGAYLFLSVITLGLWLVSWISACIGKRLYPWQCEHCGWLKPQLHPPADQVERLLKPYRASVNGPAGIELKTRAEVYRRSCKQTVSTVLSAK